MTPVGRRRLRRVSRLLATLAAAAAPLLGVREACAETARQTAPKPLTQYHHDVWLTHHGLPTNAVNVVVQTQDGYLWLGTEAGLVRFDGVKFTTFDRNSSPVLRATDVRALLEDRAGNLWIGTDEGSVIRLRAGRFEDVAPNRLRGAVTAFHEDRQGRLWVAGGDEVARLEGEALVSVIGAPGVVTSVYEEPDGSIWLGAASSQVRLAGDRLTVVEDSFARVQAFVRDRAGASWIGTPYGLLRTAGGVTRRFTTANGLPSNNVRALLEDRSGGLWIGTIGGGLAHLADGQVTTLTAREGLSDVSVTSLFQDREGSLWVGTRHGGLNRLRSVAFSSISRSQGLPENDVLSVFEDRRGHLWIGTDGGGLTVFSGAEHFTWTQEEGLPGNVIWTIADSADGSVWVGTPRGLARIRNRTITSYVGRAGYPQGGIRAIHEDRAGNLWIGNRSGLHRINGETVTTYTEALGLSSNNVSVIREDQQGTLWIGTLEGGLNRFKNGRFTKYTTSEGLTSNNVSAILCENGFVWVGTLDGTLHLVRSDRVLALPSRDAATSGRVLQILSDDRGSLWLSGQRGLTRFERSDLLSVANGVRRVATPTLLDHEDGFGRWEFHGVSHSAAARRADGTLVFASASGAIVVDASKFSRSSVPAPVHIERIVADGREIPISPAIQVPAGQSRLEIHYTALSYGIPERLRFRYKLEGVDEDWVDAGNRRVAYYTGVPGGRYLFSVRATNYDGVWNPGDQKIAFAVGSRFWETWWFRGLLLVGAGYGIVGLLRLRLRRHEARARVLQQLVDERTAELSQEVKERRRIEESLRQSRDELEDRVEERTAELSDAYAQLQRDVTERRRLEDQLAQVQKLESIGRLAGGVAHDINNVLTVVLSYSDLVDAGLGHGHPLQSQIRQIRKAAERASNLTHRLLAFARKQVVEPRVINLGELALNLDGMLHRLIGEDVELTTVTSPNLWSVKADPHQIEQVLVNLAVNARDAMPHGGALRIETTNVIVDDVFAKLHPTLQRGEYVRLNVTDTGVGMDDHVKRHIFEPFFTTKEPGRGTGLGLATCYGIVQQLNGTIFPESEVGRGTIFNVFLPRVDLPAEPAPRPQPTRVQRGTETVLLVEDEPLVREIARSALTDQGYEVIEAEHGEQALVLAREHDGDIALVLTDVVMPKMGGRELVESLRLRRPRVRVLYMSGYAASTLDEQDVVEPGTAFLRKPFALAEMLRKVRTVLDDTAASDSPASSADDSVEPAAHV
jgi:ligand-binding sensor domain-containing protein/signal transduction histidine kinase/CheY-like chemotaxis protein